MWDHVDNFRTLLGMESLKEVIERGEDSLRVLFSLWENEMMTFASFTIHIMRQIRKGNKYGHD